MKHSNKIMRTFWVKGLPAATMAASMGAFAFGCGGNGNPAGNSNDDNNNNGGNSNTKQAVEQIIDNCFYNHAGQHRTGGINSMAMAYNEPMKSNLIARGCAGVPEMTNCLPTLKELIRNQHTHCITPAAYDITQDNESVRYGINFELNNNSQQTNLRKQVLVSTPFSNGERSVSLFNLQ